MLEWFGSYSCLCSAIFRSWNALSFHIVGFIYDGLICSWSICLSYKGFYTWKLENLLLFLSRNSFTFPLETMFSLCIWCFCHGVWCLSTWVFHVRNLILEKEEYITSKLFFMFKSMCCPVLDSTLYNVFSWIKCFYNDSLMF